MARLLRQVLEAIKENEFISRADVASMRRGDWKYVQGYLEALEDLKIIKVVPKGSSKFHRLTLKGEEVLNEVIKEEYGKIAESEGK